MMMISVGSALAPAKEAGQGQDARDRKPETVDSSLTSRAADESVPGYTAGTWFGLSGAAGTPREIVMKINADVRIAS